MKAILRLKTILAAGLLLAPGLAHAQDATPPATTNAPAPDTVGPRELQNFSLQGTTTKPADQTTNQQSPVRATVAPTENVSPAPAQERRTVEARQPARVAPPSVARVTAAPPNTAPAVAPLAEGSPPQPSLTPAVSAQPAPVTGAPAVGPEAGISIGPWILAALMLAAGILFLLWRRRPREALASGPDFDLFAAPEPAPAPPPPEPRAAAPQPTVPQRAPAPQSAPAPARPAPASANGIVTSRLRPSIEIGMQPLRCLVDDSQVTIEFEVELFNAGAAPARAVLAEASLLNASATQDQELAAFFSNPVGEGERIDAIPPMKRIAITSRVIAPRSAVQEYDFSGRKAFVPVIAFNALYEGSGGKAQSSAAYLVGRETKSDKLGPLRLDAGAHEFRGLGARPLPLGVRT
jgi:hypothetical protein